MLKFVHISWKARKKMPVKRKWDHIDYIFAMIAVRISHNTFENHVYLVRNVTEKYIHTFIDHFPKGAFQCQLQRKG